MNNKIPNYMLQVHVSISKLKNTELNINYLSINY